MFLVSELDDFQNMHIDKLFHARRAKGGIMDAVRLPETKFLKGLIKTNLMMTWQLRRSLSLVRDARLWRRNALAKAASVVFPS